VEELLITYAIYGAIALLVFFILRVISVTGSMPRLDVRIPFSEIIKREDCPAYVLQMFRERERQLEGMGFIYCYAIRSEHQEVRPNRYRYGLVYFNREKETYASLLSPAATEELVFTLVEFNTFFKNGERLATLDGRKFRIDVHIPNTIFQDSYSGSLQTQWQLHQHYLHHHPGLETRTFAETGEGFQAMVDEENRYHKDYIALLVKEGFLIKTGEDRYKEDWRKSSRSVGKSFSDVAKIVNTTRQKELSGQKINVPVEMEIENYENARHRQTIREQVSSGKVMFLGFSMMVFLVSFSLLLSFQTTLLLLAVLLVHESCHLLAMWMMDYKDWSLLFIPIPGIAAQGRDKAIPYYKQVVANFGGSAPGLLMAIMLWFMLVNGLIPFTSLGLAARVILMLLVINYFKLLPVVPMDGGKILDIILYSRSILPQTVLMVSIFLGLIVLGERYQAPMLWFLALLIPYSYNENRFRGKLLHELQNRLGNRDDVEKKKILHTIFTMLREEPYKQFSLEKKNRLARFLEENVTRKKATAGMALVTMCIYVLVLVLPVVTIVYPVTQGKGAPPLLVEDRGAAAMKKHRITKRRTWNNGRQSIYLYYLRRYRAVGVEYAPLHDGGADTVGNHLPRARLGTHETGRPARLSKRLVRGQRTGIAGAGLSFPFCNVDPEHGGTER
jgi:hypothetical protein